MTLYNLLLHLYPASFRNEYGGEMRAIFERRRRDTGAIERAALWIETVAEMFFNAALVQWDVLRQDASYCLRALSRIPGFAITVVLMVALGIGATTAVFSVTDVVLLRPLPFPGEDRLVKIWERLPGYQEMELSPAHYRDWTSDARTIESSGGYIGFIAVNLTGAGEPQRVERTVVTAGFFRTLGVKPISGRVFEAADDDPDAPATVVLSYGMWRTTFAGDPSIVGRSILLDNAPHLVLGVMPAGFRFPSDETALWTPARFRETAFQDRNNNVLNVVARLAPGRTLDEVRAELGAITSSLRTQYPKEDRNTGATVRLLHDAISSMSRLPLLALMAASACILLIACANLANMLLARALARRRELAVRTALGAGRERLVRQLMTESVMLAFAGGLLGLAVAALSVPLLARLVPPVLSASQLIAVDGRVLAFAAILTLATAIVFGLAPILRASDTDLDGLREGSRAGGGRRERLRAALVVSEIVASVVLLVSAGLLLRALLTVRSTDPGFASDHVLTMRTALPLPRYARVSAREDFYQRVLQDVRALPGVTGAAYISFLPIAFGGGIWPVSVNGEVHDRSDGHVASLRFATPEIFSTLHIPVVRGRAIEDGDGQTGEPIAVVSESFARQYWPGQDPIGRGFNFASRDLVVAGVVGDIRMRGLEEAAEPQVYLASKQMADGLLTFYSPQDLVVRSTVDPETLAPAIRAIVRGIDPTQPVSNVRTLTDVVDNDTASRVAQLRVIGAFAAIAILLAGLGIHGLLSFSVSQRSQEIAVRVALGATRADIVSMVLRQCLVLAGAGIIPGLALAYAAGRGLQALLVGVTPGDAMTFATVAVVSLATALAGSLAPTWRALRVNPITAMRTE